MKKLFENWNKYVNEQSVMDKLADLQDAGQEEHAQNIVDAALDFFTGSGDLYKALSADLKPLADELIDFNKQKFGDKAGMWAGSTITEGSSKQKEILEEDLKSLAIGAVMAFLTQAGISRLSAPETVVGAKASIAQMQKEKGDEAARKYIEELIPQLDPDVARAVRYSEEVRALTPRARTRGIGRIADEPTINDPKDVEAYRRGEL